MRVIELLDKHHDRNRFDCGNEAIPLPLLLITLYRYAIHQSTIVVATHADLSWAAKLFGLEVPLLEVETLLKWAHLRIKAARLSDMTKVNLHLTLEIAEQILAQSGNSWRSAATLLHIWVATNAS